MKAPKNLIKKMSFSGNINALFGFFDDEKSYQKQEQCCTIPKMEQCPHLESAITKPSQGWVLCDGNQKALRGRESQLQLVSPLVLLLAQQRDHHRLHKLSVPLGKSSSIQRIRQAFCSFSLLMNRFGLRQAHNHHEISNSKTMDHQRRKILCSAAIGPSSIHLDCFVTCPGN